MNLLQASLAGGSAFREVNELLANLTWTESQASVPGAPYTLGDLLVHIATTMRASLDLVTGRCSEWPQELEVWPAAPADEAELQAVLGDLRLMLAEATSLAHDPSNRARDILLDLAVHNAYHWGQIALIRRQQGFSFNPDN